MTDKRHPNQTAIRHLQTAVEADDPAEKDFHIRQALQLLVRHGDPDI